MENDCFTRLCGHKAQAGIRMISEALSEFAMIRNRSERENEALALARKNLASVNLLLNVIVAGDEARLQLDA